MVRQIGGSCFEYIKKEYPVNYVEVEPEDELLTSLNILSLRDKLINIGNYRSFIFAINLDDANFTSYDFRKKFFVKTIILKLACRF
ncbi:hypothetical protein KUTeg_004072 [Tegillarca granosa]|uniref:Uncharacterized protein n=1 Tax=Tegillarca granosa TaxID=220873 RepID=A0ABQ9FNW5_TEGGR|nr:hypothetical protein KUTeg_004072 [Tegillarca granosa]